MNIKFLIKTFIRSKIFLLIIELIILLTAKFSRFNAKNSLQNFLKNSLNPQMQM
jgi:hypothetical protein